MSATEKAAVPFIREDRYIVIKLTDLANIPAKVGIPFSEHLTAIQRRLPKRECLVIESDWPEHPVAWAMIEARMTGKQPAGVERPDSLPELTDRLQQFLEVVRSCERLASDYSGSLDGVDEHGGDDHEDPICAVFHRLYYAMFDGDKLLTELRAMLAAAPHAVSAEQNSEDEFVLPCDIKLPGGMTIGKGCTLSTLMLALRNRGDDMPWRQRFGVPQPFDPRLLNLIADRRAQQGEQS